MSKLIITTNGDFSFPGDQQTGVTQTEASTILIMENSADATLIFGCANAAGDFVAYPEGEFRDGARINHGLGCQLMVRTSGIASDSVTIRRFPN